VRLGRRDGIGANSSLGSGLPGVVGKVSEFVGKDGRRGGNGGGTLITVVCDEPYVIGAGVTLFGTAGRVENLPLGDGP